MRTVTWICPKQSSSGNRAFIFPTWFTHAHRNVVATSTFSHKSFYSINVTFVENNCLRNLLWVPSRRKSSYLSGLAIPTESQETKLSAHTEQQNLSSSKNPDRNHTLSKVMQTSFDDFVLWYHEVSIKLVYISLTKTKFRSYQSCSIRRNFEPISE